jgi:folylpolyglutamate synthase/dihydropteroate synthase
VTTAGSVAEALSSALDPAANPAPDDVILVTGSLGTAAEARVALGLA